MSDTEKVDRNKQMSLREAGAYDKANNLGAKLTGWGIVSKDRRERGISRKARREQRKSAGK
jgi:hypothetical protein